VNCKTEVAFCKEQDAISVMSNWPVIRYFGVEEEKPRRYNGPDNQRGIVWWLKKLFNKGKSDVERIDNVEKLLGEDGQKLILFSSEEEVPLEMKALRAKYRSCSAYITDASHPELLAEAKIKVEEMPKLVLRKSKTEYIKFEGEFKFSVIVKWVDKILGRARQHDEL